MVKAGLIALLALTILLNCSDADTLGDEPPVEVVISGQPTWENGIGELVRLKCGYCHGYPIPDIAPNDIITDLDLNVYETRVENGMVIRGADAVGSWIREGILDRDVGVFFDEARTDPVRQMPLDYGTPVTEREKAFLEMWSAEGSSKDGTPDPEQEDFGRGNLLYGNCAYCHGQGEGVPAGDEQFLGPSIRRSAVTVAKVKSMWLDKVRPEDLTPLADEDAAILATFIRTYLPKIVDE